MTSQRTSIALSIETYNQLHNLKSKIERIVRKKLDYSKIIDILLCTKSLDDQLYDMIVEAEALYPSKTKKEESNHESR